MEQIITILPKILDQRSKDRGNKSLFRRMVIHNENPIYNEALKQASWYLNAAGMRMYNQAIVMSDKRQHLCTIDGNVVTEKYEGRNTRGYIGEYTTDGSNCNCSWFAAKYICRHLIYYRVTKNLPIFEKTMFHKSFVSGDHIE